MTPLEEAQCSHTMFKLWDHLALNYDLLKADYPKIPNIELILNDELTIQASARPENNEKFIITINDGLLFIVMNMFWSMLSTKSVLAEVGDPTLETEGKKDLNTIDGISYDALAPKMEQPLDYTRRFQAIWMIHETLTFIYYHEACHIIRGHSGCINNNPSIQYDVLFRQTLEMDADSMATNRAIMLWFKRSTEKSYPSIPLYKNLHSFIRYWSFSIYSFFRISGFKERKLERETSKHPPPRFRMNMIINNIIVILTQLAPEEDMKVIGKIVLDAAEEAEHAFTEITFHDNDFDFFIDSFQEWDNYINKIRMNWNVVRPQV